MISSAARFLSAVACVILASAAVVAQTGNAGATQRPWMNKALSPDQRAELVLKQMTLDEKIGLLHGQGFPDWGPPNPKAYLSNGGAGYVLGVERLGIPMIQMSDAAYGVRNSAANGRYSTALTSPLGLAASWDTGLACDYGALIGRELRAQGYNMSLGGGVNLARELRNGRNFEYGGEDPVLAGTMIGNLAKCEQAQHVIGDIKHYALNDQESGRNLVNVVIGERAMRETDLLAFEIAIGIADPGAVMCAYNGVNGDYACENKHLLGDILKGDWKFPGFVLSDWGGTHSTVKASAAGLDQEEPLDLYYGPKLKQAVQSGQVPMSQIDDHARRILRAEFAAGIVDEPVQRSVVDVEAGFEVSRHVAENSAVLLRNENNVLPLDRAKIKSIAIIGEHADTGMISGGGSAQVDPMGGRPPQWKEHVWFPSSPLKAVKAEAPDAAVRFDSGANPASAAALAKQSDVAIVFVHQWTSEDYDLPTLALSGNQNELVTQVAEANPRTIVVVESGSAITMPWIDKVPGVLEVWFAGTKGADATAALLFGEVAPSGKLPITFPRSDADLPHATVAQPPRSNGVETFADPANARQLFTVTYDEGLKVGYKWYDAEHKPVLFPFGFGLSYTTFEYSGLSVSPGSSPTLTFTVKNTGQRAGAEVAEVYVALPSSANEPPKRLVAWSKTMLQPGESKQVTLTVDQKMLSIYDEAQKKWTVVPGSYTFLVGGSSDRLPLKQAITLE